jgi:hypothetical protein
VAEDRLLEIAERVVAAWNRAVAGTPLPPVERLNADRLKQLRARLAEHDEPAVLRAIGGMARSDWHSGRSGQWRGGNLGWLLRTAENFEKMLEREPAPAPGSTIDWTPERRAAHLRAVAARQAGEGALPGLPERRAAQARDTGSGAVAIGTVTAVRRAAAGGR